MIKFLKISLISLNALSFIVPLAADIYFLPTLNFGTALILFSIDGICLLIWFISICTYCFISERESSRYKIISVNVCAVIIYLILFFTGSINKISNYIFLKINEDRFGDLVHEIKENEWIEILDTRNDCSNSKLYNLEDEKERTCEEVMNRLKQLEIYRYLKENEIFYFCTGGSINHIHGFAYSEFSQKPERINDQRLKDWNHIYGNWYSFGY